MNEFIQSVKDAMKEKGISQSKLAEELAINGSALSQYFNGLYKGDSQKITGKLKNWLGEMAMVTDAQLASSTLELSDEWQATETAQRILFALEYANTQNEFTFVCTEPGMGKTITSRKFKNDKDNVCLVRMTTSESTPKKVLQEIAYALGSKHKSTEDDNKNYITSRLLRQGGHLVIDEAQHMSPKCIEAVRGLYDKAEEEYDGIGLTLLGNVGIFHTISEGNKNHDYGQIFSRIGLNLLRKQVTNNDVSILLKGWGLEDEESTALLTKLAKQQGALRNVKKRLKLANVIAMGANESMTVDHILQAEANNVFSK